MVGAVVSPETIVSVAVPVSELSSLPTVIIDDHAVAARVVVMVRVVCWELLFTVTVAGAKEAEVPAGKPEILGVTTKPPEPLLSIVTRNVALPTIPAVRVPTCEPTVTELTLVAAKATGLIVEKTMAMITVTEVTFLNLSKREVFIQG